MGGGVIILKNEFNNMINLLLSLMKISVQVKVMIKILIDFNGLPERFKFDNLHNTQNIDCPFFHFSALVFVVVLLMGFLFC